jgi:hypothetical protein
MFRVSDDLKKMLISYGFTVKDEKKFEGYPSNEFLELVNNSCVCDTKIYRGPSRKMQEFLLELVKCCPSRVKMIKRVRLEFWRGNQYRAKEGSCMGVIEADPIFDEVIKESDFRWVDMAFGIYSARFRYDLSKLKE